ncbi:inner membrane complex protein 1m, putative [Plasmodium vinckei vinckei]|uniref:Inner membrane complex protein 1m, putative n=1 Tax=Plasmodium vinckei vinckei TaxID=54757 RepID=A0A081IC65_PLAVN|nr:inner membrane complex protein 1m, putative [Plasmodium vinckei vinckei]KEG01273.1 hypothetical protein YYE_03861 [Plasmodium vinckei vinckei]VEV55250.1 inner membrane complex protein 1m, putative [Plasmodium vinckei vinckei]
MYDSICNNEKGRRIGILPVYIPGKMYNSQCTTMEDLRKCEAVGNPGIKNIVQETTINVPKIQYKEKVVEIPRVEYRAYPVVKDIEAPIYKDRYIYKDVEVPQKQVRIKPVYNVVNVPQYKYVEKAIKKKYKRFRYIPKEVQVPFRPKREIYTEIPMPRYIRQYDQTFIEPQNIPNNAYTEELPLFEGYNDNFLNMINPFYNASNNRTRNSNGFLSCLCNNNNNIDTVSYENLDPLLFSEPTPYIYNNNYYGRSNTFCCSDENNNLHDSLPYEIYGYNYPIIKTRDENYLYKRIIEAASSVLAATGVAIILAGKLGIYGISLLLNNNTNQDSKKEIKDCPHKKNKYNNEKKEHKEINGTNGGRLNEIDEKI